MSSAPLQVSVWQAWAIPADFRGWHQEQTVL